MVSEARNLSLALHAAVLASISSMASVLTLSISFYTTSLLTLHIGNT